jgi:nitrite reductase/ring-hydroxylating ferredoxin subunit
VCALGITTAPDAGAALLASPALGRNSSLRVHVSGCPNSCAQHQAGDIGLAGSKVRVGGRARDGYQVYLGADLDSGRLGQVVGRVAAEDVPAAVEVLVGAWESMRHGYETLGQTVARVGEEAVAAHIAAVMADRWGTGPEPPDEVAPGPVAARPAPDAGDGPWATVIAAAEVGSGAAATVEAHGARLALTNVGGTFFAVDDRCPHAGASLGEGSVEGWCLECPLHGASFDVRSGEVVAGPAPAGVRTWPVRVEGGMVQVAPSRAPVLAG